MSFILVVCDIGLIGLVLSLVFIFVLRSVLLGDLRLLCCGGYGWFGGFFGYLAGYGF